LLLDWFRRAFVVLVQEEVRLEPFFCYEVIAEQFPPHALRFFFTVLALCYTPMSAGRTADEYFYHYLF
jgi:hypothetical protein